MSDQTVRKFVNGVTSEEITPTNKPKTSKRPRSMTTLKLQWLAERARKCQKIKAQIEAGEYRVDSKSIARSLLDLD